MKTVETKPHLKKVQNPGGKSRTGFAGNKDSVFEKQSNILVIDDRPHKLLTLEGVLDELDQNLIKVNSGQDALRELLHRDFAVIVLDVAMLGTDGFETAELIC